MVKERFFVSKNDNMYLEDGIDHEEPFCAEMEADENETGTPANEVHGFTSEGSEGSNVVFSREAPLISKESRISSGCSCSAKNLKSRRIIATDSDFATEKIGHEKKLSKSERVELGKMFQSAMSSHDWELAESLILLADLHTLNDALCITLDSIWFLRTQQELHGVTGLIKKIIANGAYDFTRAASGP